jgi:hypothetical protein
MPEHDRTPSWFSLELIVKAATIFFTLAGLYYGISTKVDRLSDEVREIKQSLPNKERDAEVMKQLAQRVAALEDAHRDIDTWVRNTRERLAEHGWRP